MQEFFVNYNKDNKNITFTDENDNIINVPNNIKINEDSPSPFVQYIIDLSRLLGMDFISVKNNKYLICNTVDSGIQLLRRIGIVK